MSRLTWTTKRMLGGSTMHIGSLGQLHCAFLTPLSAITTPPTDSLRELFNVEVTLGGKDRTPHQSYRGVEAAKEEAEQRVTNVLSQTGLLDQLYELQEEIRELKRRAAGARSALHIPYPSSHSSIDAAIGLAKRYLDGDLDQVEEN